MSFACDFSLQLGDLQNYDINVGCILGIFFKKSFIIPHETNGRCSRNDGLGTGSRFWELDVSLALSYLIASLGRLGKRSQVVWRKVREQNWYRLRN